MDRPNIRLSPVCPLCCKPKEQGLLACWPCFRASGLRYCRPEVEAKLDDYERQLVRNRQSMERQPRPGESWPDYLARCPDAYRPRRH